MFENEFSERDPSDSDDGPGERRSGDNSSDHHSTTGRPLSDEFELTVGDSLIIAGQSVVVVAITDDEVTFELADGFAFDANGPDGAESSPRDPKSRPPR